MDTTHVQKCVHEYAHVSQRMRKREMRLHASQHKNFLVEIGVGVLGGGGVGVVYGGLGGVRGFGGVLVRLT